MEESGITSAGKPWIVRLAEKVAAKNDAAVVARGTRTCTLLLILNLLAELGSWSIQFLTFLG
jgi:hypothetical protein